ncbi:MAG: PA14 domain-containing protein, partial [Verrucomicrobiota bacterium]
AARNDGERWRYLLAKAVEADPSRTLNTDLRRANFLREQFGVRQLGTLLKKDDNGDPDGGIYSVRTLKENQTLTRLATGVRRFTMPEEYDFMRIYRSIADIKAEKEKNAIENLVYRYYEGDWDTLPDFSNLEPKTTGTVSFGRFHLGMAGERDEHVGLVQEGRLKIPEAGTYTFTLHSDDGAVFSVDDKVVVNHDGLHSTRSGKTGSIELTEGMVSVRLSYFQKTGKMGFRMYWSGPGFKKRWLSIDRADTVQDVALEELAEAYEDRRQRGKAAAVWKEAIERFGSGNNDQRLKRLAQLEENWCRLETTGMHPAGKKATLDLSFRNAGRVAFTAHRVKGELYFKDIKDYLRAGVRDSLDARSSVDSLGHFLIDENETRYLGEEVARWDRRLTPAPDHQDRRVSIKTPLSEAGIYLVTAEAPGG